MTKAKRKIISEQWDISVEDNKNYDFNANITPKVNNELYIKFNEAI
jgi:hypothetical protein